MVKKYRLDANNNLYSVQLFLFTCSGEETYDLTEVELKAMAAKVKAYCERAYVFQIVISRRYQQVFHSDEYNVYRILRFINPFYYLFF